MPDKRKRRPPEHFELIARAIVRYDGKVLACNSRNNPWWFLPGGHIELGETAKETIVREIKEELGIDIEKTEYIGTAENIYTLDEELYHEMNIVFVIDLDTDDVHSQEDHVKFEWVTIEGLMEKKILPVSLKEAVAQWLEDNGVFFVSEKKIDS